MKKTLHRKMCQVNVVLWSKFESYVARGTGLSVMNPNPGISSWDMVQYDIGID